MTKGLTLLLPLATTSGNGAIDLGSIWPMVGALLVALSGWCAIMNAVLAYRGAFKGEHHSLVWFIGAIIGAIGILLLQVPWLSAYWWVPFVVDIGGGPWILVAFVIDRVRRTLRS